jgi:hypothetical protein
MATVVKRKLSGSTNGKAIKVAATATLGTTIHTAVAGTTAGTYDEIWLWAYNHNTSAVVLTIEGGGAGVPDDIMMVTLAPQSGWIPLEPGFILQNGLVVTAFASVANKVTIRGWVNAITD